MNARASYSRPCSNILCRNIIVSVMRKRRKVNEWATYTPDRQSRFGIPCLVSPNNFGDLTWSNMVVLVLISMPNLCGWWLMGNGFDLAVCLHKDSTWQRVCVLLSREKIALAKFGLHFVPFSAIIFVFYVHNLYQMQARDFGLVVSLVFILFIIFLKGLWLNVFLFSFLPPSGWMDSMKACVLCQVCQYGIAFDW